MRRWIVRALLALGLLGCTVRLGGATLWQDEALTAFLGRTVLDHGIPKAWDGRNLAHDLNYQRLYNDEFVWIGHPWLPFYVAAAGLGIGGLHAGAARLPFALAGWLALALLYPAGVAVLGSRRAAIWALVAGVLSVPFFLYTRQCQYYPLLLLGTVLLWWGLAAIPDRPRAMWLVVLGLALMAHSNPVSLGGVAPACLLATLRRLRELRIALRYALAGSVAALTALPFFLYARSWQQFGLYQANTIPAATRAPLLFWRFLWEANLWVFPLAALPLLFWAMRSPTGGGGDGDARPEAVRHLALDLLTVLATVSALSPWPFFRYVLPALPLGFWLLGAAIARVPARRRTVAFVLAASLLGTRLWSAAGHRLVAASLDRAGTFPAARAGLTRLEPYATRIMGDHAAFVRELAHGYQGPVDALLRFFRERAGEGQTLAITYPQEPLALFTHLRVVARIPAEWPEAERLPPYVSRFGTPDWIVVRAQYPNSLFDVDAFFAAHGDQYIRHELPFPDTTWNNRPYPLAHRFRTPGPEDGPPIVIWERR